MLNVRVGIVMRLSGDMNNINNIDRVGIVICSRLDSKRLYQKPLQKINNIFLIRFLIARLLPLNIPICLAIPADDDESMRIYDAVKDLGILLYQGNKENVLERFYRAGVLNNFKIMIRITHDDIFQCPEFVFEMLNQYQRENADYIYCSNIPKGCDCEVVSIKVVEKAVSNYDKLEHLSYAFRKYATNIVNYNYSVFSSNNTIDLRIDYSNDLCIAQAVLDIIPDFTILNLRENEDKIYNLMKLKKRPVASIMTGCYNNEDTIVRTIKSVQKQKDVAYEYFICDDNSSDSTREVLWNFFDDKRITVMKNIENKGIAYTSNKMIERSAGKYIIRLDADDEFVDEYSVKNMIEWMNQHNDIAIAYAAYYDDDGVVYQNENHHVAGAIIRKWMFDEVQFNEKLRHWDGLDLYNKIKKYFQIGYIDRPSWIYHYRHNSLSHNKLYQEERERIYGSTFR